MVANPNWPMLFAEGQFSGNPYYGTVSSLPVYVDMTGRLHRQWSVRRGKQFELDAVQPGEWTGQWINTDGMLDPSNTSGLLYPNVVPYRGFRVRTQYPPSVNLLNGDTATAGEVSALTIGTGGVPYLVTGSYVIPTVQASGTAWQGTKVWQAPHLGGLTPGSNLVGIGYCAVSTTAGTPYTVTYRVRSTTSGGNPVVTPFMGWVDEAAAPVVSHTLANVTLTGATGASWTTVTQTDTVPAGAVALAFGLKLATAPAGAWGFEIDGIQLEQAAAASTFVVPSKNYPVYSGLIERYPQLWEYTGTYGLVSPVCVDTMALLSQTILKETFVQEVVNTSPQWFFPLNDPSGSTTFAEQAGRTPSAGLFVSGYGAGAANPGSSITSTTVAGSFLGTAGPVVSFNNPTQNQGTVINLVPAGIAGAPSTGAWTRMIAFRTVSTIGETFAGYSAGYYPGSFGETSNLYFGTQIISGTNAGASAAFYNAAGQFLNVFNTSVIVNDGNWHLAFLTMSSDGKTVALWVDGLSTSSTGANDMHQTLAANDSIGNVEFTYNGTVGFGSTFVGDVALYAQWGSLLSSATMVTLYGAWRTAGQGESSDQRYARILGYAGYLGAQALDVGATTSMLPANDISGKDALSALEAVVATEAGRHFVAADGTVTFQSRNRMFLSSTPVWTFGENAGEIPYDDIAFDFDPTRLSNDVTITQVNTNSAFTALDATSQAAYGSRAFSRSSQSTSAEECREAAFYYLSRYKDPQMRVSVLRVNVAANPALFPSALAFELGQRVRINRRDPSGVRPTITMDGFIEQITHSGDDMGHWDVNLQISSATKTPYAVFTALQTTLHAAASAGATTISINALPDAATNVLRSELTGGQVLVLGYGGANQELVSIATGGVPTTSLGYTSATVTLLSPLVSNHLINEPVIEGQGLTYDALAVFDAVQFAY